ncbi:hypothetical protein NRY95_16025 [Xanthomonas campestris pv. phormiicola]|nr:hypothetical protein [Xanthomonas campestris pv. phormiicola]UYC15224.1 hypothetical protein NRY95_16025 [Xanthomonas campestris pv. phormiicola]
MAVKRMAITVGALCVLSGAAWIAFNNSKKHESMEANKTETSIVAENSKSDAQGSMAPNSDNGDTSRARSQIHNDIGAMKIGDPLYGPKSQQDVKWLMSHGYPTQAQLQAALSSRQTLAELQSKSKLSPVDVIQAGQLAMSDSSISEAAIEVMNKAAVDGSVFALQEISRTASSPSVNDPIRAAAYKKAAEMRGDWGSALLGDTTGLNAEQSIIANAMSYQIIENINRARAQNGSAPLVNEARPGVDEFLSGIMKQMKNK